MEGVEVVWDYFRWLKVVHYLFTLHRVILPDPYNFSLSISSLVMWNFMHLAGRFLITMNNPPEDCVLCVVHMPSTVCTWNEFLTGAFVGYVLEKWSAKMFYLVKKSGFISLVELTLRITGLGPQKVIIVGAWCALITTVIINSIFCDINLTLMC